MKLDWINHPKYRHINVIDAHTGGEPLRIIVDGFPKPEGKTILEKRRWVKEHADDLRKALMWEPRGHADMYGVMVTEPERDSSDFGVIFMHNEGYSTMCGHGIIGVTKVVLETGMFPMQEPETVLRIDSPAGQITAHALCHNGEVTFVSFLNVPSFLYARDKEVVIDGFGKIVYDIAFGGAFYAFVNADEYGIAMTPENVRQLIDLGMKIKYAVMESVPVKHPFDDDLSFLYGTIFYGKPH
ncbi:MAG: proline racemase, partial [Methanobacteriota archaeon]